jgi:hypothetical protein
VYLVNEIPIRVVGFYEDIRRGEVSDAWQGEVWCNESANPRLQMLATLVAPVTDEKQFGTDFRGGDKGDLDTARMIAEDFCLSENMDEMLKEAQCFVDDLNHWAAIKRIACKMLTKLENTIKEKPFPRKFVVSGDDLQKWYDK